MFIIPSMGTEHPGNNVGRAQLNSYTPPAPFRSGALGCLFPRQPHSGFVSLIDLLT